MCVCLCVSMCYWVIYPLLTQKSCSHILQCKFLCLFSFQALVVFSPTRPKPDQRTNQIFLLFFSGMFSAFTVLLYFTLLCLRMWRSCGESKFCHVSNRTKHAECLPGMLRAVTAVSVFYYHYYYYDFFFCLVTGGPTMQSHQFIVARPADGCGPRLF